MNEDVKMNHEEGFCEECGAKLCSNCGKCCHCGKCDCVHCHPHEEENPPKVEEPINYS